MSDLLRLYAADELMGAGYPRAWERGDPAIKDLVREQAGYRCIRCRHPYPLGIAAEYPRGEWTPCDEECCHGGPVRGNPDLAQTLGDPVREARWRILTVHHLNGDKADCRWWNLAALCQRCHLTIQGRVVMKRAFILEHSEWFKPHAAGFYADKYLRENLTREETEARLDELLALERRW